MLLPLLNERIPFVRAGGYQWRFSVLRNLKEEFRSTIPEMLSRLNDQIRELRAFFEPLAESLIGTNAGQFMITLRIEGFGSLDNEELFKRLGQLHEQLAHFVDFSQETAHNILAMIPTGLEEAKTEQPS